MEGLQIYPITKLCYKRQDHVLGIEIGREDAGVKLVFQDFKQISNFLHICALISCIFNLYGINISSQTLLKKKT